MAKHLLIVESPAKAKTIEGYLGKDYQVQSSYGHVRDLAKEGMGVDIKQDFLPNYVLIPEKEKIIKALKKSSQRAVTVYLATDDDREGEAISWHLAETLELKKAQRIVFQEITKKAIQEALSRPRGLNMDLVESQQARRILDRIVGFEISPILWQKIKGGLSAGRVQSVAVRLIVERERQLKSFSSQNFFSVKAALEDQKGSAIQAKLPTRLSQEEDAKDFLSHCASASFSVAEVEKKLLKRNPPPPFMTSTLQQEASRLLGFAVGQTMRLAQRLYEAGKISYMRTDSLHLSDDALSAAAAAIKSQFGEKYYHLRHYKTRSKSAQEAHEAIRPTDFSASSVRDEKGTAKLYDLIWRRAMASQMSTAEIDRTLLHISVSNSKEQLLATGEVLRFDGFLRLYVESSEGDSNEEDRQRLAKIAVGEALMLKEMVATESFTKPAPRYTEATLVRELEEKGIGRPSTYAPTIDTIQKRAYVVKESRPGQAREQIQWRLSDGELERKLLKINTGAEKNKLFPTDIGMLVNDFLQQHFSEVIDYSFTAEIEEKLDKIANGEGKWQQMLALFYKQFHPQVQKTRTVERKDIKKGRQLGKDPHTGKEVHVLLSKFGPYVQLGELEEGSEKPPRASLRKNLLMENITLQQALDLLKLPRRLGTYENSEVIANEGRYGPYIQHEKKFYNLPKDEDPTRIELPAAITLIKEARLTEKKRVIKAFEEDSNVQVLNGRYGPYIKFGNKNVRIPKNQKPEALSYEDCKKLAERTNSSSRGRS